MLELSKQDAADIVNQLSKLINMKINIVNNKSIIIANSDENRVGDFHEATKKIIENNLPELIAQNNTELTGTQVGTNLPLVINGKIIGVVGITGEVKTARAYGQIIKKMCEILIQGKARDILIEQRKLEKELFEIEWICKDGNLITDAFIAEGYSFNINIMLKRRVLVFYTEDEKTKNNIINKILLNNKSNVAFKYKNTIVAAIKHTDNDKIIDLIKRIKNTTDSFIHVGIDSQYVDDKIYDQFLKANKALQSCSQNSSFEYIFYENLYLELIEDQISLKSKKTFIQKVFKDFTSESEIIEAIKIISLLYKQDGSIKSTAGILGIHPNTLQYKLNKISDKTNLDPRKLKNIGIYSLAIRFIHDVLDIK
ncbi:MAG: CdaR family transcriptional regulator [Sphaerochaeta sp.]